MMAAGAVNGQCLGTRCKTRQQTARNDRSLGTDRQSQTGLGRHDRRRCLGAGVGRRPMSRISPIGAVISGPSIPRPARWSGITSLRITGCPVERWRAPRRPLPTARSISGRSWAPICWRSMPGGRAQVEDTARFTPGGDYHLVGSGVARRDLCWRLVERRDRRGQPRPINAAASAAAPSRSTRQSGRILWKTFMLPEGYSGTGCLGQQPGGRRVTPDRVHRHREQLRETHGTRLCRLHRGRRDGGDLPLARRSFRFDRSARHGDGPIPLDPAAEQRRRLERRLSQDRRRYGELPGPTRASMPISDPHRMS